MIADELTEFADSIVAIWSALKTVFHLGDDWLEYEPLESTTPWQLCHSAFVAVIPHISALAVAILRYLSSCSSTDKQDSNYHHALSIQSATHIAHYCCYILSLELSQAETLQSFKDSTHPTAAAVTAAMQHPSYQELNMLLLAATAAHVIQQSSQTPTGARPNTFFASTTPSSTTSKQQQEQAVGDAGTNSLLQLLGISENVAQGLVGFLTTCVYQERLLSAEHLICAAAGNLQCSIRLRGEVAISSSSIEVNHCCSSNSNVEEFIISLHSALLNLLLQLTQQSTHEAVICTSVDCMQTVRAMYATWITADTCKQEHVAVAAAVSSRFISDLFAACASATLQALERQPRKDLDSAKALRAISLSRIMLLLMPIAYDDSSASVADSEMPSLKLVNMMQQQPYAVLAVAEAVARTSAAGHLSMSWVMRLLRDLVKSVVENQVLLAACHTAAAPATNMTDMASNGSSCCCSDKHKTQVPRGCNSRSPTSVIVSFLISCLKFTSESIKCGHGNMLAMTFAAEVALLARRFAAERASRDNPQQGADHVNAQVNAAVIPWLHVVARALYCCGTALLWPHIKGTAADKRAWMGDIKQASRNAVVASQHYSCSPIASEDALSHSYDLEVQRTERSVDSAPLHDQMMNISEPPVFENVVGYKYFGSFEDELHYTNTMLLLQQLLEAATWSSQQLQHLARHKCSDVGATTTADNAAVSLCSQKTAAELDRQHQQLVRILSEAQGILSGLGQSHRHKQQEQKQSKDGHVSSCVLHLTIRHAIGYQRALQIAPWVIQVVRSVAQQPLLQQSRLQQHWQLSYEAAERAGMCGS